MISVSRYSLKKRNKLKCKQKSRIALALMDWVLAIEVSFSSFDKPFAFACELLDFHPLLERS